MKLSRKLFHRRAVRLLFIFIAFAVLIGAIIYQQIRINSVSSIVDTQTSQMATLSERVGKMTYNPSTLSECIDLATKEYVNFIKQNGDTSVAENGKPAYSLSEDQWKKADAKYTLAKQSCEELYGK